MPVPSDTHSLLISLGSSVRLLGKNCTDGMLDSSTSSVHTSHINYVAHLFKIIIIFLKFNYMQTNKHILALCILFNYPENIHIHNAPFNCIIENAWPRFVQNHQEQIQSAQFAMRRKQYNYLLTSEGLPNQEMKMGMGRSCRMRGLVSVIINFDSKLHIWSSE